jgi:hypothetical protein
LKPDAKLRSCAGDILDIIGSGSIPVIQIYYLDQVKLHRIGEISLDDSLVGDIRSIRSVFQARGLACQKQAMIIHTDRNQADHRLAENLYGLPGTRLR